MLSAPFRFDADDHTYTTDDGLVPSITGLLSVAGWINDRWYTADSSARGKRVHALTASYDLGALDAADFPLDVLGYLRAHQTLTQIVKPQWRHIEVPAVHRTLRFAGTCDRVGHVYGRGAILEVKSGDEEDGHVLQTALQAILVADELALPAESIDRYAAYYREDGRYKLKRHDNPRDFVEVRGILARYCR